ncbi:thermonuclease family protein [Metabacillus mangrovi]|nr:thermonuclease family protein [Metabacillus mangrovi]
MKKILAFLLFIAASFTIVALFGNYGIAFTVAALLLWGARVISAKRYLTFRYKLLPVLFSIFAFMLVTGCSMSAEPAEEKQAAKEEKIAGDTAKKPEETQEAKEEPKAEKAAPATAPASDSAPAKKEAVKPKAVSKGLKATVIRAVDGDTLEVKVSDTGKTEKIRLILVDTPETKHPQLGVQPFGKEASAFTADELTGKNVELEKDVTERDRYGRVLAYVWIDGVNFNKLLIEKGLARVAIYQPDVKHVDEFRAAQEKAQQAGKGIWSIENYVQEDGYVTKEEPKPEPKPEAQPAPKQGAASKQEEQPSGSCDIKGNQSGIYHVPRSTYYERTKAEVMFCSVEEAEAAGYRAPKR